MHDGAIYYVVDLVRLHADFEVVDRRSVRAGFLHHIARSLAANGRRVGITLTTLQQPGAVLRDGEVDVILVWAFELASAEDETVIVRVIARLHERNVAFAV